MAELLGLAPFPVLTSCRSAPEPTPTRPEPVSFGPRIEASGCVDSRVDAGIALPENWRIIPRPWGYCAVRSGRVALAQEERDSVRSAVSERLPPPPKVGVRYDGNYAAMGSPVCLLSDLPECPNAWCICPTVYQLGCEVSTTDLAVMFEEELVREAITDVYMIACVQVNAGPSVEE